MEHDTEMEFPPLPTAGHSPARKLAKHGDKKMDQDVLIIGTGLAGLSAGMELANQGWRVRMVERFKVVGGRCADWVDDGMHVESGLHRWLGFYRALPALF